MVFPIFKSCGFYLLASPSPVLHAVIAAATATSAKACFSVCRSINNGADLVRWSAKRFGWEDRKSDLPLPLRRLCPLPSSLSAVEGCDPITGLYSFFDGPIRAWRPPLPPHDSVPWLLPWRHGGAPSKCHQQLAYKLCRLILRLARLHWSRCSASPFQPTYRHPGRDATTHLASRCRSLF